MSPGTGPLPEEVFLEPIKNAIRAALGRLLKDLYGEAPDNIVVLDEQGKLDAQGVVPGWLLTVAGLFD